VVAKSIEAKLYEGSPQGRETRLGAGGTAAKEARREAVIMGCDTLMVDTAGRLHIDEELMGEMERLKSCYPLGDSLYRRRHAGPGRRQTRRRIFILASG